MEKIIEIIFKKKKENKMISKRKVSESVHFLREK